MKKTQYIYRIAEANYGHEADRFYAKNDQKALRKSEQLRHTIHATVMLVGEVDESGSERIYAYEEPITL